MFFVHMQSICNHIYWVGEQARLPMKGKKNGGAFSIILLMFTLMPTIKSLPNVFMVQLNENGLNKVE